MNFYQHFLSFIEFFLLQAIDFFLFFFFGLKLKEWTLRLYSRYFPKLLFHFFFFLRADYPSYLPFCSENKFIFRLDFHNSDFFECCILEILICRISLEQNGFDHIWNLHLKKKFWIRFGMKCYVLKPKGWLNRNTHLASWLSKIEGVELWFLYVT